ncbi:hypothetical protein M011DRAFT_473232 [Sporormia fimetaria CBS 119925]|uniref:Uncharacterized protein n=1 Tax=Sporormia fimetaria CBS 119925 TaxID=1340428 RepID=A0A6A6VQ51_9PLEO|nr:hypothetical protein M011DRAFT_473232 [Sporormia fimetaria CBS 119925]
MDDRMEGMVGLIKGDIFWRTMRPLWMTGKINTTMIFMAQLMLDIHRVCGPKGRRFDGQLQHVHNYAQESFEFEKLPNGGLSIGGNIRWHQDGIAPVLESYYMLLSIKLPLLSHLKKTLLQITPTAKMYDARSVPAEFRRATGSTDRYDEPTPEMAAALDRVFTDFIKPSPDDDFVTTHNPAGVNLANYHRSIFTAAHLYNAVRQLQLLKKPWPVMDRIIQIHQRAIFADAIPTRTVDMCDRLRYRLNLWKKSKNPKDYVDDSRSRMKAPELTSTLNMMLEDDPNSYNKALWQIEKHIDDQPSTNFVATRSLKLIKSRNRRTTPEMFIRDLQTAFDSIIDEFAIDYIRLTRRCIKILEKFRDMFNVETQLAGLPIKYTPQKAEGQTFDWGLVQVVLQAFNEAKAVRDMGIYSYAAGDGDDVAHKGPFHATDGGSSNPDRHGLGLNTAAKVFDAMLEKDDQDYMFPYKMPSLDLLEAQGPSQSYIPPALNRRVETASGLRTAFANTVYAVVEFYTDYARKAHDAAQFLFTLAEAHAVDGILTFICVNADGMREEAKKYYEDSTTPTYVCFKDGKQVTVNGLKTVTGKQRKALKAAVEKLSTLAQKRLDERKAQQSS